jgi:hypothetical protein
MQQYEAVIAAMRAAGGFATLARLYADSLKVPDVHWGTKTPHASIRRIVQTHPAFFRIRPGLWGLKEMRREIAERLSLPSRALGPAGHSTEFDHTYYQGLAVELGNYQGQQTVVPNQDRNRRYLLRPLGEVCSLDKCYTFSYDNIVARAKYVDVVWFNERRLPSAFIEIEFTPEFVRSLVKFCEFQDFRAKLVVVADACHRRAYDARIGSAAFVPIHQYVEFMDFEQLAEKHARMASVTTSALSVGTNRRREGNG